MHSLNAVINRRCPMRNRVAAVTSPVWLAAGPWGRCPVEMLLNPKIANNERFASRIDETLECRLDASNTQGIRLEHSGFMTGFGMPGFVVTESNMA